jgi:hypothetical protein
VRRTVSVGFRAPAGERLGGALTSGGKERMKRTTTGMTQDHLYEVMASLCGSNFSTMVSLWSQDERRTGSERRDATYR